MTFRSVPAKCSGTGQPLADGKCSLCGREVPARWAGPVSVAQTHVGPDVAALPNAKADAQAAVCALIRKGLSVGEAAARVGVTYKQALRMSEPVRPRGHPRARWSERTRRTALQLLLAGASPGEVSERTGVPLPTLYRWRAEAPPRAAQGWCEEAAP